MDSKTNEKGTKQRPVRLWFQTAWFVLTNSYVRGFTSGRIYTGKTKALCVPGLNCYSCPGALGSCPMGSLQAVMGDSGYRFSLYVFGLIAAMGVLFGRLICGWMCPFGLVQDLLYRIKVKIKKKNLPGHKYLRYLRYVILVVFPLLLVSLFKDATGTGSPWFCEWICPSGTLLGGIPLVLANAGLRAAIGFRFFWKLFLLIVILLLSVFYYRPFCKYLCPLGAIYGLFNPVSSYRLVIDHDKCISCGRCQKACGMDIRTFETPNSPDCIRCGSCISACPKGAISSTWKLAGEKVRSRCFIDDEPVLEAGGSQAAGSEASFAAAGAVGGGAGTKTVGVGTASAQGERTFADTKYGLTKKSTFLGILMIVGGLNCGLVLIMLLYTSFNQILSMDYYQELNALYIPMIVVWLVTSMIILATGIYILRNRKVPARLLRVRHNVILGLILALIGLPIGIISVVIDNGVIIVVLTTIIYCFYVLIGTALLLPLCTMLQKTVRFQKTSGIAWGFFSLIGCVMAVSPWVLFVLMR